MRVVGFITQAPVIRKIAGVDVAALIVISISQAMNLQLAEA
jgi:hypothetical protein